MFDIYDSSTYSEIPDAYIVINGEKIYKDSGKKEFVTFKQVANLILDLEKYFQKSNPSFKMSRKGIDDFLYRLYLSNSEKNIDKRNKNYNPEENFTPKKSDLILKGYQFTIAQKELMKHLSQEEKEKLTDMILNHFANKQQKNRLKQDIFDKFAGKIDNYFFADLCYIKDIETEKELMYDYYSGFDTIESKEELEKILNNEYLNLYPQLKKEVRDELLNLNF